MNSNIAKQRNAFNDNWTFEELSNVNMMVTAYLTSCFIYYHHPDKRAICSDSVFDRISIELLKRYDELPIETRVLISHEDLQAGTGFSIREDQYPLPVKSIALSMSNKETTLPWGQLASTLE